MPRDPDPSSAPVVHLDLTEGSTVQRAVRLLALHDPRLLRELVHDSQQHGSRDGLTGVWERAAGLDQLRRAVERSHRTLEPLVVVFVDLDDLKGINDGQSHAAGDHALTATGVALQRALRSDDLVLRYGGDEFVCALPHAGLAQAESRLRHVGLLLQSALPGTRLSSGFAMLQPGQTATQVIGAADADMYARRHVVRAAGAVVSVS